MTERMIDNRVKKLRGIEAQIKELEKQAEALKNEIKTEMGEAETYETPLFIIRWTNTTSNRFDSTAFKKEHSALYTEYLKQICSRRFTVTAK